MLRLTVFSLCMIFYTVLAASAQEEPPLRSYTAIIDENGDVQIIPLATAEETEVDSTLPESSRDPVGAFPELLSDDAITLIKSQDWYAGFGAEGELKAVYTLPRGEALSGEILAQQDVGWGIQKVEPAFFRLGNIFPDDEALIKQLDDFVTTAVRGFCGFEARPTEFESEVDISPGWGAAGKIRFKGKWVSSDVCSKLQ